jgi:integrase
VLVPEEVKRILAMAASLKALAMLTISYGCCLRAGEVVRLRVCDIDSAQMIIRVVQSKGHKDRYVMLPPSSSACCGNGGRCDRNGMTSALLRNSVGCFPAVTVISR